MFQRLRKLDFILGVDKKLRNPMKLFDVYQLQGFQTRESYQSLTEFADGHTFFKLVIAFEGNVTQDQSLHSV